MFQHSTVLHVRFVLHSDRAKFVKGRLSRDAVILMRRKPKNVTIGKGTKPVCLLVGLPRLPQSCRHVTILYLNENIVPAIIERKDLAFVILVVQYLRMFIKMQRTW